MRVSRVPKTLRVEESGAFAELLTEMRLRAGFSVKQVAEQMGVRPGAVYQYLHRRRGEGGTSTVRWLARYAEVCGCAMSVTWPDGGQIIQDTNDFPIRVLVHVHWNLAK